VPFDVNVKIVPAEFQEQWGTLLHARFLDFHKFYLPADKFPVLSGRA